MINVIAAIGRNRELGRNNALLWRIPEDLKRFKNLTMGHPLVMGRKTFESIGKPLPGRTNIVITRDTNWKHEGVVVAESLQEALEKARAIDHEIFIIGGASVYEQALPYAQRLYLTLIDDAKDADAFFPEYEDVFKKIMLHRHHEHGAIKYSWVDLEK